MSFTLILLSLHLGFKGVHTHTCLIDCYYSLSCMGGKDDSYDFILSSFNLHPVKCSLEHCFSVANIGRSYSCVCAAFCVLSSFSSHLYVENMVGVYVGVCLLSFPLQNLELGSNI